MRRVLVVTPPVPVVTVAEAKQHLRVDSDDQNAMIEGLIAAATAHIDGPDGYLRRAIGSQVLEAGMDSFCYDRIDLPYPPVIEVQSIRYEGTDGVWRTLDPGRYETRDGSIGSAWGVSWPAVRRYRGASRSVLIRYKAGYAVLPPPIRVAILMMTADLFRSPGSIGGTHSGTKTAISAPVEALLAPYRLFDL
ncbi:head-tail connector protein [Sphingomonas sp. Leaf4]|uniref:head-tail connector protein n=1 Tax=Sphingomonas sp. Leaf4 TaxID=2876553 RepID=UPI001E4B4DE5|nr:head-tail connector protein [Sphingomonas sp. Leaf4]